MKDELLAIILLPPSTWSMLQSDRLRVTAVAAAPNQGQRFAARRSSDILLPTRSPHQIAALEITLSKPRCPNPMPYNTSQRQIQLLGSKLGKLHAHTTFKYRKSGVLQIYVCRESEATKFAKSAQTGMAVAANARGVSNDPSLLL